MSTSRPRTEREVYKGPIFQPFKEDPICSACYAIFTRPLRYEITPENQLSLGLANPSQCKLCALFVQRFKVDGLPISEESAIEYLILPREGHLKARDIVFQIKGWPHTRGTVIKQGAIRLALQPESPEDYSYPDMVRANYDLSTSTGSEESLDLALQWYETCLNNHEICTKAHNRVSFIPSRLIEIMRKSNGGLTIRLRTRKDFENEDDLAYATLSHRWARSMPFRLTSENLTACLVDIPYQSLSGVFQDAVRLADRFKLRYIWIDSICIVQDSVEDWRSESTQMSHIYNKGVINLAATGCFDGQISLFTDRDRETVTPIRVAIQDDQYTIYQHQQEEIRQKEEPKGNYYLCDVNVWKDGVDDAPLCKRGWVVQERASSVRTLHFGKNQLFWECCKVRVCEAFPDGLLYGTPARRPKEFSIQNDKKEHSRAEERDLVKRNRRSRTKAIHTEITLRRQKHKYCTLNELTHEDDLNWMEMTKIKFNEAELAAWANMEPKSLATIEELGIHSGLFEGCEPSELDSFDNLGITGWEDLKARMKRQQASNKPKNPFRPSVVQNFTQEQSKWTSIVEAYSGCDLTFSKDKLVAISGIAKTLAEENRCEYLCGLWRTDLEHQLLWKVVQPKRAARKDRTRGPSWSWTSCDGSVLVPQWWGGDMVEWFTEVEQASIESVGSTSAVEFQFGQVRSGCIRLKGNLGVFRIKQPGRDHPGSYTGSFDGGFKVLYAHFDTLEQEANITASGRLQLWRYSCYGIAKGSRAKRHPLDVFYLAFRIMKCDPDGSDWPQDMITGLLLMPTGRKNGEYNRVGQFEMSEQWSKDSVRPLAAQTEVLDSRFYAVKHKTGEYTVTIV